MRPPLTKICGLSTPDSVGAAARLGADYVGFVHFPKSPRHVSLEQAASLAVHRGNAASVMLLVNPDMTLVEQAISAVRPDVLQLHGDETAEFLAEIARRHDVKLWKALPVRTRADLGSARAYHGVTERILFDAKPPPGADIPGGNGVRFDWELLRGAKLDFAWGLSGGLDPANVAEALRITRTPLLDISSGVEDAPGQKNVDKMASFLNAVRTS